MIRSYIERIARAVFREESERRPTTLGPCPVCRSGQVRVGPYNPPTCSSWICRRAFTVTLAPIERRKAPTQEEGT